MTHRSCGSLYPCSPLSYFEDMAPKYANRPSWSKLLWSIVTFRLLGGLIYVSIIFFVFESLTFCSTSLVVDSICWNTSLTRSSDQPMIQHHQRTLIPEQILFTVNFLYQLGPSSQQLILVLSWGVGGKTSFTFYSRLSWKLKSQLILDSYNIWHSVPPIVAFISGISFDGLMPIMLYESNVTG